MMNNFKDIIKISKKRKISVKQSTALVEIKSLQIVNTFTIITRITK